MSTENQHIVDDGALWKFFHSMLNMDDDDLDPYQYRVLGHYRRICGAHGYCDETVAQTALKCKIGHNKIRQIRNWLAEQGYIELERTSEFEVVITLKNRLIENIQRYQGGLPDQVGGGSTGSGRINNNNINNNKRKTTLGETSSPEPSPDENNPPVTPTSTRFTASRFYAFNEKELRFGAKNYTKAESEQKAEALAAKGYVMVKGSELNKRADADQLIAMVSSSEPDTMFEAFALHGYGIKKGQPVPDQTAKRIGEWLNGFAELLGRTRNEVNKDVDLITRVNKCYENFKRCNPTMSKPNHISSFTKMWNDWTETIEKQVKAMSNSIAGGLDLS